MTKDWTQGGSVASLGSGVLLASQGLTVVSERLKKNFVKKDAVQFPKSDSEADSINTDVTDRYFASCHPRFDVLILVRLFPIIRRKISEMFVCFLYDAVVE